MRKLDKQQILSTEYKKWEDDLENNNKNHPKYSSSNGKFYLDIVMNLFYIQKGLCAYTEQELCDEKFYKKENWVNGKYKIPDDYEKVEFYGQLEHFDESLKSKNGEKGKKDWLWSNFFMAQSDTNTKIKGRKSVDKDSDGNYVLKPDELNYNKFDLLEYDYRRNIYRANRNQNRELKTKIERMINEVLGLNYGILPRKRGKKIIQHLKSIKFKEYTWQTIPFGEFPTAIEMYRNNLNDM